ncbi:hypothetical protein [Massilia sp. CCM 8734]|uniref:DUF7710 domain-containing protein n=1 Tax=Massilia sp. CCM 8734 TaxID=2609283 RepID=UPI00141EF63B|nr:hypothetical protein [Massilia sp. CCM 8734]NHZ98334.1 hypothetical protein [Massilia sp. CCM 8734]
MKQVWVFNGAGGRFPSAIFEQRADAEKWIASNSLTGVLTQYPVGIPVYDWAIGNDQFRVKNEREKSAAFIQKFSSSAQPHIHFDNGKADSQE